MVCPTRTRVLKEVTIHVTDHPATNNSKPMMEKMKESEEPSITKEIKRKEVTYFELRLDPNQ